MNIVRGRFGAEEKSPIMKVREDVLEVARTKQDVVVPFHDLSMSYKGKIMRRGFDSNPNDHLTMSDWAQGQLFNRLNMPSQYFKKMLVEQPELVADHANFHIFNHKDDEEVLVRTYGGKQARAFLSNRYSKCDNDFVVDSLSKMVANDHTVKESYWDDRSFHLRMVFPDLTLNLGKLKDGRDDLVQVGIHIINSEVGARSLTVESVLWRQVCTNGLVVRVGGEVALQQRHVFLRDHEIQGRLNEAITKCIQGGYEGVEQFASTKEVHLVQPLDIIDKLAKQQKFSQEYTDAIKTSYAIEQARSGDTQFTLVNAFTDSAKMFKPDTRVDIEKFAGTLLTRRNLDKLVELDV